LGKLGLQTEQNGQVSACPFCSCEPDTVVMLALFTLAADRSFRDLCLCC
jgi:hypothetical protein